MRTPLRTDSLAGRLLLVALAGTGLLLLAHAWSYFFLTDDAFISFRYARNLAHGYGLVFNPGHEAVEGYTNFLWVLLLAVLDALGLRPESAAPWLSLTATVGLWAVVALYPLRVSPPRFRPWLIVVPTLLLAVTRSVAVWSTGGLETRLFSLLVVAGVLRAVVEVRESLDERADPPLPASALLFALAALTRPPGLLVAASTAIAAALVLIRHRRLCLRRAAAWLLLFATPVAAHFLFRRLYYGAWLPNTYYAKVDPGGWWSMGLAYLGVFALEYAAWIWLPWVLAGVIALRREGRGWIALLLAAAIVPHALYIARVGGDHFEYRPLDFYFPLLFLLVYEGLASIPAGRRRGVLAAGAVALIVLGLVELPLQSRLQAPREYISGFPGAQWALPQGGATYMDPDRDPIYRWPPLRFLARLHAAGLRSLSRRFVGIRQEEHAHFSRTVTTCGLQLRRVIDERRLPRDIYIAIDSVGAIPYYGHVRTLDRLGLTDAHVARGGHRSDGVRAMAHDRYASIAYAIERGVDLWAVDNVRPIIRYDDPVFEPVMERAARARAPIYWADVGQGYLLVALLLEEIDAARARMPELDFHPARDRAALATWLAAQRSGDESLTPTPARPPTRQPPG